MKISQVNLLLKTQALLERIVELYDINNPAFLNAVDTINIWKCSIDESNIDDVVCLYASVKDEYLIKTTYSEMYATYSEKRILEELNVLVNSLKQQLEGQDSLFLKAFGQINVFNENFIKHNISEAVEQYAKSIENKRKY